VNTRIRAKEVRVIDPDGEQVGVMSPEEGIEKAEEFGLDLVEVAPKARPPVCRIMDYGKFKYQQSKKKASNKSDNVQLKTFRMRPNIGDHDLNVKLRQAGSALDDGDQVKLVMRLRGRERAFTDRWVERLGEIVEELQESLERDIKVTQRPKSEGREITAMVEPA
jgi:translation initiation factor IF-3